MPQPLPNTLGALRRSGYCPRSVKDEMRGNLIRKLEAGERLFPGILGYEESVVPQLVNALLARHNFILLGLRGQAKSRILRELVGFLDDRIPIIAGSEVNDDPFHPISKYGRLKVEECGACHRKGLFETEKLNMLNLKAAYHQQCIDCHVEWEAGPTECAECHEIRE